MRKVFRGKRYTFLCAYLTLAAIACLALLHTPPAKNFIFEQLRRYLRNHHGIELDAEHFNYNLFALKASLESAELRSVSAPAVPFLTCRRLDANLSLTDLIRRPLTFAYVGMEGANFNVRIDEQGTSNLPASPPSAAEAPTSQSLPILFSSLLISRSSATFSDASRKLEVSFPLWHLSVQGNAEDFSHHVAFQTESPSSLVFDDKTLRIGSLLADGQLRASSLRLNRLESDTSVGQVRASGSISGLRDPDFDLRAESMLDLQEAAKLIEFNERCQGTLSIETSIEGPLSGIRITNRLEGSNLSAAGVEQISLAASADWSRLTQLLQIEPLSVRSGLGSAEGGARLYPGDSTRESSAEVRSLNLDLQALSRHLKFPVEIASSASGSLVGRWKGWNLPDMEGEARLRVQARDSRTGKHRLPITASISVKRRRNESLIDILSAEVLGSAVRGQISFKGSNRLSGLLRAECEAAELLPQLDSLLGRARNDRLVPVKVAGKANLEAGIGGTRQSPLLSLSLSAPAVLVDDLAPFALAAKGEISAQRLVMSGLDLTWAQQTLQAEGSVSFTGDSPSLDITAHAENVSIASLLSLTGRNLPADGTLEIKARLGGTLEKPLGNLDILASDLQLYGEEVSRVAVQAALDGKNVELRQMRLDKNVQSPDDGLLTARGSFNYQTKNYEIKAEAQSLKITNITGPNKTPLRGTLSFAVSGQGTLSDPQADFQAHADDVLLMERSPGPVTITGTLRGRETSFAIVLQQLGITTNGHIQAEAPYQTRLEISADESDISLLGLKAAEGLPLTGSISGHITASGDLSNIRGAAATLDLSKVQLLAAGYEINNLGQLQFRYNEGTVVAQPSTLTSENARLDIAGSLPILESAPPGSLQLTLLTDVPTLIAALPLKTHIDSEGIVTLDILLEGSGGKIRPSAELNVLDASFRDPATVLPMTDVNIGMRLKEGAVYLDKADAKWGAGTLSVAGELPLSLVAEKLPIALQTKSGPATFVLDAKDVHPESFPSVPESLTGTVTLHAEGKASELDLKSLDARITFEAMRLNLKSSEFTQTEPALLSISGGEARIDRWSVAGPQSRMEASGTVRFADNPALNLHLKGSLETGILSDLMTNLRSGGAAQIEIDVLGTPAEPEWAGLVRGQNLRMSLLSPRLQGEDLDVLLKFDRHQLKIEKIAGILNGGIVQAAGYVNYSGTKVGDVSIDASATSVFLDFPAGLRTSADAEISVSPRENLIVIGGAVHILEGSYREPLNIEGEVLRYLQSGQTMDFAEEPNPFLSRIRYNIALDTPGPLIVDNNLAKLAATANLRLAGTYYRPVLAGRMNLEDGGEIYLNERKYLIEKGSIDFIGQNKIEPSMDILAKTQVGEYEIDLHISGTPDKISTSLTSDSHSELSEPDLLSILITGRTLEEFRGAEFNVAKEQAMSYVAGRLGTELSRKAEAGLGLSQVRIEPNLISPESDPGARLTIGQDLTRNFRLVYSMDLVNSQNQTWIADYNITRRFNTRAIRQDDSTYRFDFRHDLTLGGRRAGGPAPAQSSRPQQKFGEISFTGNSLFSDRELADKFKLRPGEKYDYFKLQKGSDKVKKFYLDKGYAEAQISTKRAPSDGLVDISVGIEPGPKVTFVFDGASVPRSLEKKVEASWQEGVFDAQRADEAMATIRTALVKDGFLQPSLAYEIEDAREGEKRVVFRIDPGTRYSSIPIDFEGAQAIPPQELRRELKATHFDTEVFTQPEEITQFLTRFYRTRGYLNAAVSHARYDLSPESSGGRVVIPIKEGPLFRIRTVKFQGNTVYTTKELSGVVPVSPGLAYAPEQLNEAVSKLEEFYWKNGYNDVVINQRIEKAAEVGMLDIKFDIEENRQEVVQEVLIEGTDKTDESFVRKNLEFSLGHVLNYDEVNRSRKKLYDSGAYSSADIEVESMPSDAGAVSPVRLLVKVREVRPYQIRYGGFYDTERGPGAIVDAARNNLFGSARVVGLRGRYDGDLHEVRGYLSQPGLRFFPLKTNFTVFLQREFKPATLSDSTGFSLQQEAHIRSKFIISYGYRYQRIHIYDKEPDPVFPYDIRAAVARLTLSVTRETRDDLLDATRGSFSSQALQYSPLAAGSDFRFLKYFGQYFKYLPLTAPSEIPWSNGLTKPRLVYAGAIRVGLGRGFDGQGLLSTERFYAGGGTTMRGFEQDQLGPLDFEGNPIGGDAMFITNHELRFPIFSIFDGVGFLDLGNVYTRVSDFDLLDLRKSAGFGLRVRTPYLVLRFDYGLKLDRKPGESRGKFFFSIGQAF